MEYLTIEASRMVRKNLGNYEHDERMFRFSAKLDEGEDPLAAAAELGRLLADALAGTRPTAAQKVTSVVSSPVQEEVTLPAPTLPEPIKETTPEPVVAPVEMTAGEFLTAVSARAKEGKGGLIMAALTKYRAGKVSEVPANKYAEFLAELA